MRHRGIPHSRYVVIRPGQILASGLCALLVLSGSPPATQAATPESPDVVAMVDKGIQFLAANEEARWGGKCLVGLTFLKAGQPDHPRVTEAVDACREMIAKPFADLVGYPELYSVGLAIVFLCELDPKQYRSEIDTLLRALWQRQKPGGGWGYQFGINAPTGDTSMTQYAVLAMWTAHKAGLRVESGAAPAVCEWLLRTQDPSGAWGYQGVDPGNYSRVAQSEVRPSLAAAGLGSVYVCANLMGMNRLARTAAVEEELNLPDALVPVAEDRGRPLRGGVSRSLANQMQIGIRDGNRWMRENLTMDPERYKYYYLYALERYFSFREVAEGKVEAEPSWYNAGVELLKKRQADDGRFSGECGSGPCTAFAVLFLLRSTKKSIQAGNLGDGLLVGGRGLPTNTTNIRVHRGKIVNTMQITSAADLLSILEDEDHPDFAALADDPSLALRADAVDLKSGDVLRLRSLAKSGPADSRRAALTALATQRNLDNVPIFIYALGDPDPTVFLAARDALRFTSRKLSGFDMPNQPTKAERDAAIQAWKDWYRNIHPQAEFIESRS